MKNTWTGIGLACIVVMLGVGGYLLMAPRGQSGPNAEGKAELQPSKMSKERELKLDQPANSRRNARGTVAKDLPNETEEEEMDSESETTSDSEPAMTEEEKKEAEEAKRVEEFDAVVDKWMNSQGKSVTMAEVDKFRDMFRRVPKERKEESVQRALNLIPDDNVMLLAGILFDKEQDKEILDLVFNDILNRDEEVKKPILKELFNDKEHPNWADTAWILDMTGQLPGAKE